MKNALTVVLSDVPELVETIMLRRLLQIGRDEKLSRIAARIMPDNREMIAISRKLGFEIHDEDGLCVAHRAP